MTKQSETKTAVTAFQLTCSASDQRRCEFTVDAAVISRETVRETAPVVPVVRTGKNGTWVGVAGRF